MSYSSCGDYNFFSQKVLARFDFNVPVKNGAIIDTTRIDKSLPTLQKILQDKPKRLIIVSHFGRPNGSFNESFSLRKISEYLSQKIGRKIFFESNPISNELVEKIEQTEDGSIIMLENIRFYKAEEENNSEFNLLLSKLADVFVNDAFSCSHRAHSSVAGVASYLPSFAGVCFDQEIKALDRIVANPKKPIMGIIAGSKVSTKLDLLKNLLNKLDFLFIGGGMANTLMFAKGFNMGKSLIEHDRIGMAENILQLASNSKCKLLLPQDVVVAISLGDKSSIKNISVTDISFDDAVYDIGIKTVEHVESILKNCKTVFWNGPLGIYEVPPFETGSVAIAKIISELTENNKIESIVGGGDTIAVLTQNNFSHENFTYISTAGGAFLEYLEGKSLPGFEALKK